MATEMVTSSPVERRERKSLGAFYSPSQLVEPMVSWAISGAGQAVLDPSCGDGVFLESAARRLRALGTPARQVAALLHAIDLNPDAAVVTRERLTALLGTPPTAVRVADFFSLPSPGTLFGSDRASDRFDAVIGNPPYIRYQEFAGRARVQALGCAADAGVELTRLASSWAHFVAHAVAFLKPGGRLALILPAELIHTAYAAPLRRYLRASFGDIAIVAFRQAVFPGVQAEVVLLLAAGRGEGPGTLALVEAEDGGALADLDGLLARAEIFRPDRDPEKWLPGQADHPGALALEDLERAGRLQPLGAIGKAGIGFVSGANDFFVLTPSEAARRRLPRGSLRPALIRARHVPGLQVTGVDLAALRAADERCCLWLPGDRLTPAEQAYVRAGEELSVDRRYKCQVRTPWYRVPGVVVPDAFLTYMSDAVPRLCWNDAGAVSSNTLHNVRLPGVPPALARALVTAFYNSATLLSCERVGRSYGGGVLKLEPREADRILLPSLDLVARHQSRLERLTLRVDTALRAGRGGGIQEALSEVDHLLFSDAERRDFADLRAQYLTRRRARRPSRARVVLPL